jgi:hypothetical protein
MDYQKYLTRGNVAAVLVLVAAVVAHATGQLDLVGFVQLVLDTLGGTV